MFLVNIQEVFAIPYQKILDSSFSLILAMIEEYGYKFRERNREDMVDEKGEFEWIELPSWDNPNEMVKMKKYKDISLNM